MRFTCERCGKKYATAEDPAPGRVYKLKCKACGHLIVVKTTASAQAAASGAAPALETAAAASATAVEQPPSTVEPPPAGPPPLAFEPPPADPPTATGSIGIEIGTPEPARIPENGAAGPESFDATTQVSTAAMAGEPEPERAPSQAEPGYVDLFSDVSGLQELSQKPGDDPFLAAARASLPDGYGAGFPAPDPFAALRDDISAASEPGGRPRASRHAAKVPFIPKPKQQSSKVPLLLIGAGVAVLVGILAFVLISSKGQPQAPTTIAPAAAPPMAPAVAPSQPEAATPVPAAATLDQGGDAERRARAEQRRKQREEAQAREEKARAERDAKDREKADRDAQAKAKAEREAKGRSAAVASESERQARPLPAADKGVADPEGGLTQAQIEGVLRSTKPAFDGCIEAARGTAASLDGRRVMLRLNIQTTGAVTHPTLDDATLNDGELGACLRNAARLMVFPRFKGETMQVEVPLVVR